MPENNPEDTNNPPTEGLPEEEGTARRNPRQVIEAVLGFIGGLLIVAVIAVLFVFDVPSPQQLFAPAPTATLEPTLVPTLIPQPTATAEPTLTPTPEPTAVPASAYQIPDMAQLIPPLPGIAQSALVLNDSDAVVDPPFSDPQWVSSENTGLNIELPEGYHVTYFGASVEWETDVALDPGLYQIFILDTLYSSAGSLTFNVALGGQPLEPYFGSSTVNYRSSFSTPPQESDMWHSIGVYNLPQADKLSISTSWGNRDDYSIVAIDRALILKMPASSADLLAKLPLSRQSFIIDNRNAVIEASDTLYSRIEPAAWGDEFQDAINPASAIKVSYEWPDRIPVGTYQIYAWLPAVKGSTQATYTFSVEGNTLGLDPVTIDLGGREEGQWVEIGTFEIPAVYGDAARAKIEMNVPAGAVGDVAVDAVAFIRTQ